MKRNNYTHLLLLFILMSCSTSPAPVKEETCDILIVGGGIGGVAAAIQACDMAQSSGITSIIMTEETEWLGGQYTSQGVTAADDNGLVVQGKYTVGASELYFQFHETIRDYYRPIALKTAETTSRTGEGETKARNMEREWIKSNRFSPGNAWSSRMSFLPKDGVRAINDMLKQYLDSGLLKIEYNVIPMEVFKQNNRVTGVKLKNTNTGEETTVKATITLDATELGYLLPLSGSDYRIGIEASEDTNEPSLFDEDGTPLYPEPLPDCMQSFTYTFAIEWRPEDEDNRLPWENRPANYEQYSERFTMIDANRWFPMTRWNDFAAANAVEYNKTASVKKRMPWIPSFWTYRRMLDAQIIDPDLPSEVIPRFVNGEWITDYTPDTRPYWFTPNWNHSPPGVGDIIEVNWSSNDYDGETIIDVPQSQRDAVLQRGKDLSLGFMFWLWYEAPRDPVDPKLDPEKEGNWSIDPVTGKNRGYANLKFRKDVMGTEDGLSMYPYIRESRRVRALFTVRQQHLMGPRSSRAALFHDTIGIGHYYLDIHRCDHSSDEKHDVVFKETEFEDGSTGRENSSGRFQIPYGSLVPERTDGMLTAAKNIGLTRIAAATYRLHPVEFQIGQAAGTAAALCIEWGCQPRALWVEKTGVTPSDAEKKLRRLQHEMLIRNNPLFWNEDAGWDTGIFEAVQWVSLLELMEPHGRNFDPDAALTRAEAAIACSGLIEPDDESKQCTSRFTDIDFDNARLVRSLSLLDQKDAMSWIEGSVLEPNTPISAGEFAFMLKAITQTDIPVHGDDSISRGEAAQSLYTVIAKKFELP